MHSDQEDVLAQSCGTQAQPEPSPEPVQVQEKSRSTSTHHHPTLADSAQLVEDTNQVARMLFIKRVYTVVAQLHVFTLIALGVLCWMAKTSWIALLFSFVFTYVLVVGVTYWAKITRFDLTTLYQWRLVLILFVLAICVGALYATLLTLLETNSIEHLNYLLWLLFDVIIEVIFLVLLAMTTQMIFADRARVRVFLTDKWMAAALVVYIEINVVFFNTPGTRVYA